MIYIQTSVHFTAKCTRKSNSCALTQTFFFLCAEQFTGFCWMLIWLFNFSLMPSYILMPSVGNILPNHTVMSSYDDGRGQAIYSGW